jgi:hypothetical protein
MSDNPATFTGDDPIKKWLLAAGFEHIGASVVRRRKPVADFSGLAGDRVRGTQALGRLRTGHPRRHGGDPDGAYPGWPLIAATRSRT